MVVVEASVQVVEGVFVQGVAVHIHFAELAVAGKAFAQVVEGHIRLLGSVVVVEVEKAFVQAV